MRPAWAVLWLAGIAGALLGVTRPSGLSDVVEVRHWSYADYTRVVVELSGSAQSSEVHRLAANATQGKPERLYVDIDGVWVGRRYEEPILIDDGLLRGVRLGQNTLRTTRLVIDLKRYERHRVLHLSGPERLVIDVYGRPPRPGSADRPGPDGSLPLDLRGVRTVVLDPGHGGRDPGAIGHGGLREKDLTLAIARRTKKLLEAQGFEVVLTRDSDRTLGLEERTAIAQGSDGDVFVSLHVNAARRRDVAGIETYYLDASNERQTLRVARRENGIPQSDFDELDRIVAMLRAGEASGYSARLATLIQGEAVEKARGRHRKVEDLGAKKGPFYVLFLSSMPSVLVETGFITNKGEAQRLRSASYQDALAAGIVAGLVGYREQVGTQMAKRGLR